MEAWETQMLPGANFVSSPAMGGKIGVNLVVGGGCSGSSGGAQGCLRRCKGGEDHVVSQVWLGSWWASSNSRTFISFFSCSSWINVGSLCLGVR